MARSGTVHLHDSPIADLLETSILLVTSLPELAPTLVRILLVRFLEAQKQILCDMLVLRLLAVGEVSLLDQISEIEKFHRLFDGIMIGLTGLGGREISQLVTENHYQRGTLVPFTLESDPCRRNA